MKTKVSIDKEEEGVLFFDYDDMPPGIYELYYDRNEPIESTCFLVVLSDGGVLYVKGDDVGVGSNVWDEVRVIKSDISLTVTFNPSEDE